MRAGAPRILVHVGLPKCGSTALQAYLAAHDADLRRHGVVYPVASRAPKGYRSHRPLSHAPVAELPARLAEIAKEAGQARWIVLSCESWADMLPGGQAQTFAAALCEVFDPDRIDVVAWFRNPVRLVESAYAQFLIGGLLNVPKPAFFAADALAPNLARFVEAATRVKGFAPFDYLGWIAALETAFAGLPVIARSIETSDLPPGGVHADLCALLDLPGAVTPIRRNTRGDTATLLALQYAQTKLPQQIFAQRRGRVRRFVLSTAATQWAADRWHRDLHVGPALRARITAQFASDGDQLARRFDTPIAGLCAMPDAPPLSDRALDPQEQAEVLAWFGSAQRAHQKTF